ncbi:aTPase AAA-2 domain protein [Clostridium sp. CAG:470]|nr:MAG: hypothetical protein BHW03_04480 [Clostridium sp. 28_17]CDE14720.1 aTPase AAA-2 domain protein [Clostridium sp. CAG:470]
MSKETKYEVHFDETMQNLFLDMNRIQKDFGLKRINSIILLKALLEEKNSILYDFLCATTISKNPYKNIIQDCDQELKKLKKADCLDGTEKDFQIILPDNQDPITSVLTVEVYNALVKTISTSMTSDQFDEETEKDNKDEENNEILINSEDLLSIFADDMPKEPLTILKNNGVYLDGLFDYFDLLDEIYNLNEVEGYENEVSSNSEKLPKNLSDFVTVLSSKYKGVSECEILGRDKECRDTMRILQKRGKKNVILVGEAGVGKSSIAEKIAYDIANGNCPDSLKDNVVFQLNVNSSIAGTTLRGMAEERFKFLIEYLEKHENVILFIDEIHMAIGAGETSAKGENDMSNALKPFLASSKAKVIGATTEEEYNKIIATDSAFKRRFKKIVVKEPKSKDVYPMLKNAIKAHEKFHGVTISKEMVEYAILISACFNNTTKNPDRTNDLIDTSMVIAKEKGLKEVTRECILENFDINFEKFKNMSIEEKKATAYHEAGHYLVWRLSSNILKGEKGIAVSIMPAEGYLGVTVFDDMTDEVNINPNRDYFIKSFASDLAGRIAEELFVLDVNSGASADLKNANKKAYTMICNYAMNNKDDYLTFIEDNNYHMINEKTIDYINQERAKLLKDASEYAKGILNDNRELLDKLVNALLEKGILDENDLNEIFSK